VAIQKLTLGNRTKGGGLVKRRRNGVVKIEHRQKQKGRVLKEGGDSELYMRGFKNQTGSRTTVLVVRKEKSRTIAQRHHREKGVWRTETRTVGKNRRGKKSNEHHHSKSRL